MTDYTPWTHKEASRPPYLWRVSNCHGASICDVRTKEEAELIASAPEMLKALKRAERWLGKMVADGSHKNIAPSTVPVLKESAMLAEVRQEGYQKGAEDMREAAARECDEIISLFKHHNKYPMVWAVSRAKQAIRALNVKEIAIPPKLE